MNAETPDEDLRVGGAEGTEATAVKTEESAPKLQISVDVEKTGSCSRHVKILVPREEIDRLYAEELKGIVNEAAIPGFRAGRVPAKLIERRFKKELGDQVKQRLLVESLEGASEGHNLDPINEPDFDVKTLEVPEEGDFEFEFDVEVRPEFELPEFDSLEIEREQSEISDEDIDRRIQLIRQDFSKHVDTMQPAVPGDTITASVVLEHEGKGIHSIPNLAAELKPRLRFHDAELAGWDQLMSGVVPGDSREADLVVSTEAQSVHLRGETVKARFQVTGVKRIEPSVSDAELFDVLAVSNLDELRERVREITSRQSEYQVRQKARAQVLAKILDSADWDLPEKLVLKQVDNALQREILEMQQAGYSRREISRREGELRQRAISTTRQALKEHFVLDKIATDHNIEPTVLDLEREMVMMAQQSGESLRRIRSRLEKSGLIENLEAQVRERMAIDFVLDRVKYIDKPASKASDSPDGDVEAVPFSVCGTATQPVEDAATEEE